MIEEIKHINWSYMVAMGYHAGLVGIRGFFVYPLLIFAFTILMVLIRQSLIDFQQRMKDSVETIVSEPEVH